MRLIDADALKARFTEELFERSGLSAQGIIDEAPTIEPSGDLISRADAIDCCECHGSQECKDRIKALPSAEQVISKLNNACDSLLTDGSNGSKEHKSKLDLISRVDAIDALSRSSVYAWSIEQDQTAHNWALNIIKALPSADADVVRCKDCKQRRVEGNCTNYYYCDFLGSICGDNEYCSFGERREP